jgi:putative NADH-flavin reductase
MQVKSMKLVIFGANGKTGAILTEQALAKGHQVTAYVRSAGAMVQQHLNLNVVIGNLNDTGKIKEAIMGADACFSTLGGSSLTKHAPEIIAGIDYIVTLMEREGVKRLIYLSSMGAGESRNFMGPLIRFLIADIMLRVPLADHTANEQRLAKSKLQWTLVRPAGLTDGPKTGRLKHGSKKTVLKGMPQISRANVASFMLELLSNTSYINTAVWLYG